MMELLLKRDIHEFDNTESESDNYSEHELGEDESVDIITSTPEDIQQQNVSVSNNVNHKFSIDNILGLKEIESQKVIRSVCDDVSDTCNSEIIKSPFSFSRPESFYQSILELPQLHQQEALPADNALSDPFPGSKLSPGIEVASDISTYPLPFHPHFGNTSSTLLYGSWIGAHSDQKAVTQIFGLQGKTFNPDIFTFRRKIGAE